MGWPGHVEGEGRGPRELRELLPVLDVDEPIVVRLRHEPGPAAARLLVSLGAGWIVDEDAPRCAKSCGRKECAVSVDERRGPASPRQRPMIHAGALVPAGPGFPAWEPNLIDWRHSLVLATKRADEDDESLEICAYCGCEVDVTPAPHKPECKGIGAARVSAPPSERLSAARRQARADVEGLDLLNAIDRGEPLTHDRQSESASGLATSNGGANEAGLEERDPEAEEHSLDEAAFPSSEATGAASETPLAHGRSPSRSSSPARGQARWPREAIVAAIQAYHAEHGYPPSSQEWAYASPDRPSTNVVKKVFGSWSDAIVAAGYERPHRGGNRRGTRAARPPVEVARREEPPTSIAEVDLDPVKDAYATALIAAARAFADTLEEELALL